MSKEQRTLEDLKDSAMLYHAKFPAFGYLLILIVFISMIGIAIWMAASPRVSVIIGKGLVQGANKSYLTAPKSGELTEVLISEGSYVDSGDLLFELKGNEPLQISAGTSGIVHLNKDYREGMMISRGETMGSITSEKDDYRIISRIDAADRPRVHEGDRVQIVVEGLIQSDYGTLHGTVTEIDSDATLSDDRQSVYFEIQIKPDGNYLISQDGDKVNLLNGMLAETRIEYKETTYLEHLRSLIGI